MRRLEDIFRASRKNVSDRRLKHEKGKNCAGVGTDGFPGLSDSLAQEIPDWGLDTFSIAQKYLEFNQLDAEIITW